MKKQDISQALDNISHRHIEEAADYRARKKSLSWLKWGSAAACLCLLAAVSAVLLPLLGIAPRDSNSASEPRQSTAKVSYGDQGIPNLVTNADLVDYTEEEMFTQKNLLAFRGVVEELQNLTVDYNGSKDYRCVAVIKVSRVYRGEIEENGKVRMLLPCPILNGDSLWQEDTDIIKQIKVGTEGIFTPVLYTDASYSERNGEIMMYKDLAYCGLGDGERWAFLETEKGIAFAKFAYGGASGMKSLDEIEKYVITMLEK